MPRRLPPPIVVGLSFFFFMSKHSLDCLQSPPPPPKKSAKWGPSKKAPFTTPPLGCAMPIGGYHPLQQQQQQQQQDEDEDEDDELEAISGDLIGAICELEEEKEEEEEELEVVNEDPLLEAHLPKEGATKEKEEEELSEIYKEGWRAYCLISENLNKTYVGITTDLIRRLRQHNGEIVGGAKANRSGRPWRFICIVRGFGSKKEACQFEWHWKHFSRKSSAVRCIFEEKSGIASSPLVIRRRKALEKVMKLKEWSSLSVDWYLE